MALILLCVPTTLFWATYEQQGNTINLWAENFTDRALIPGIIDWQIPVTWFQAFNPFMIFAFTPLVVGFWGAASEARQGTATVTKMALGNFLLALSYLIMAAAAYLTGPDRPRKLAVAASGFFVVITLGELYLSPIGLALVARVAPPQILSVMMGCGSSRVSPAISCRVTSAAFSAAWTRSPSSCSAPGSDFSPRSSHGPSTGRCARYWKHHRLNRT